MTNYRGTYKNGNPKTQQLRVTCGSTDLDVVEKLRRITGIGAVSRESRKDKRRDYAKPFWVWGASARMDVVPFLEEIRPHMGVRRGAKIDELLEYHYQHPPKYNLKAEHGTVTRFRGGCRCGDCEGVREEYNQQQSEAYYRRKRLEEN